MITWDGEAGWGPIDRNGRSDGWSWRLDLTRGRSSSYDLLLRCSPSAIQHGFLFIWVAHHRWTDLEDLESVCALQQKIISGSWPDGQAIVAQLMASVTETTGIYPEQSDLPDLSPCGQSPLAMIELITLPDYRHVIYHDGQCYLKFVETLDQITLTKRVVLFHGPHLYRVDRTLPNFWIMDHDWLCPLGRKISGSFDDILRNPLVPLLEERL